VRNLWWDPGWFPIASNGRGDHLMIDFCPAKNGTYGQLIEWLHDDEERKLLAPSFTAWLTSVADSLESGSYVPE
jgi:cell wall assembly regulator SMI1